VFISVRFSVNCKLTQIQLWARVSLTNKSAQHQKVTILASKLFNQQLALKTSSLSLVEL